MLAGIFKDKINNSESYIYLDYDNGYKYHGVEISNGVIKNLSRNFFANIYSMFKINNDCKYIKDYKQYKVYYDEFNNLYHYVKDNKEDMLMFFLKNGKCMDLYNRRISTLHDKKRKFVSIVSATMVFLCNISVCYAIIASDYRTAKMYDTGFKTNIDYVEDEFVNNGLDSIGIDDLINMIDNSTRLTDEEKSLFMNYELLYDILPYYENTNMEYVIKARLNDLNVVYTSLPDGINGQYMFSNEIYVSDNIRDDNLKKSVLTHELIHLFQADIPLYIKEASAEIISAEYYNNECNSYLNACFNLRLLVETIGPKVIWNYIFSGDNLEFDKILKNNLDASDYEVLINEFNKSPYNDNPNDNLITELIHKLYKNMYNSDILNNHDIYDFDGNYIEKTCFKHNDYSFSKMIYCDKDKALANDLVEYVPLYKFIKKMSAEDIYNFICINNSTNCFIDNTYSYGIEVSNKDDKIFCCYIDNKILLDNNEIEYYDFDMNVLDKLVDTYDFYYYVNTDNKKYNKSDKDLKLVDETQTLKSKDINFKCIGDQIVYYAKNINDRFPDQIISKNSYLQNKQNII